MPDQVTITIPAAALAVSLPHLGGNASVELLERLDRIEKRLTEDREAVLVDRPAAAQMLGISLGTLDALNIPKLRVGARVLYRPEALRAWAQANEISK